jgi:putative NIF3 family GTP cyclohydrolase 1 type 2
MKTAVQWLIEHLNLDETSPNYNKLIIDQALEMEKEQLNDACYDGYYQEVMYDTRAYYDNKYKQQYKKNSQTN